jgi:hypothetical protein
VHYAATVGNSDYNSLQVNFRYTTKRLQTLVGYTYSRSFDDASGYGEQINPLNHAASHALSAFDATNNFVVSYRYNLPLDLLGHSNRWTNGWQLSGITRFSTGQPVVIYETDDRSLLGTAFTGPIILDVDTPNYTGAVAVQESPVRADLLQHVIVQSGNDWRVGRFEAPLLSRSRHQQFRHGTAERHEAYRENQSRVQSRIFQSIQSRSIPECARQHQRRKLWICAIGSSAANWPACSQTGLLMHEK